MPAPESPPSGAKIVFDYLPEPERISALCAGIGHRAEYLCFVLCALYLDFSIKVTGSE